MTHRSRTRMFLLATALAAAAGLLRAQQPAAATPPQTAAPTEAIPTDPQITTGRFANGLRYYLRANAQPAHRAELRLVVNAGSILEDDDQQGLAHFVEHMAFNGTAHFPKQEVVTFMESLGMRFGPHVNAYTSFDETVYMLQVPTDKPEVLNKALLILEDWAHAVSFDAAAIDKERGVITEEWRLGRGAAARLQDKQFPVLLKDSRYADRLPIGKMDVVQKASPDRLKKFYADWYRPDLMAVIAVGDFDKTAVEGAIRQDFAPLTGPAAPRPRATYGVPDQPGTRYTVATDKEATTANVTVYDLQPLRDPTTVGAYRQEIVERLFSNMLSARFTEIAQKPDAPFLGAGTGRGLFVRTKEATTLGALVKEDGVARGLEALFTEAERVRRFGFTATELNRQKARLLTEMDGAVAEKDKQESPDLAAEYIRNFTSREPIPGIVYEAALYTRFLPAISLDEVNGLAKDWTPDRNRIVVVTGPEKPGLVMPDEPKLAAAILAATAADLKPYVDAASAQPLLDPLPAPGAVVKTTPANAFGVTEWELSNGVKVVLKPTTFKADEILFRATSLGGTSLASDKDFVAADTAADVVPAGGLGAFSALDLRKMLAGKTVSIQPAIGETDQSLSGGSSRKDLETLFQLIYLSFTAPRADPTMFGVLTTQMKAILANQKTQPDFAFNEVLAATLSQNHLRARPLTAELVDEMSLEKSIAFYKDRFADASGFTFTFIGSFDLATIKPLVERYLAALPALHRHDTWRDVGIHPPTGAISKKVEKGIEPKSQAAIVFTGPFAYTQEQRVAIRAMAQVLETRLRETLREDLGGTYSVTVGPNYTKVPRQEYQLEIDFGCSPARTDELVKTVFQQIELLKTAGPTDTQVRDVKATFLRDAETNSTENGYLVNQISLRYEYSEDLASLFNITDYYNKIDAAIIKEAAKAYLNPNNVVTVTLFPEKK